MVACRKDKDQRDVPGGSLQDFLSVVHLWTSRVGSQLVDHQVPAYRSQPVGQDNPPQQGLLAEAEILKVRARHGSQEDRLAGEIFLPLAGVTKHGLPQTLEGWFQLL